MNRTIQLDNYPERIVSLVPSQTELLVDLGLEKKLAGITKFCVHPNHIFKSKPRIGGTKLLNFEKIYQLNPDLIIGNKEENEKEQIEQLMRDFPVWMSDISNLHDSLEMIKSVGSLTNTRETADNIVRKIATGFNHLPSNPTKVSVLYLIWKNPYLAAGKNTFIDDMLQKCGYANTCTLEQSRYPEINTGELANLQPRLILLSSEPYPFKEKHISEIQQICPESTIKLVDGEFFSWYGSRLQHAPNYFRQLIAEM